MSIISSSPPAWPSLLSAGVSTKAVGSESSFSGQPRSLRATSCPSLRRPSFSRPISRTDVNSSTESLDGGVGFTSPDYRPTSNVTASTSIPRAIPRSIPVPKHGGVVPGSARSFDDGWGHGPVGSSSRAARHAQETSMLRSVGFTTNNLTPPSTAKNAPKGRLHNDIKPSHGLLRRHLSRTEENPSLENGEARESSTLVSPPKAVPTTPLPVPASFLTDSAGETEKIEGLFRELQAKHPEFYSIPVQRAFALAKQVHAGHKYRTGDPLMVHLLETAAILADCGLGNEVLAAALLKDILVRTQISEMSLPGLVGTGVADLVNGVSKITQVSQLCRYNDMSFHEVEADRLRTMLLAMNDVRVVIIKLADRVRSLRTLEALPEHKRAAVVQETLEVFAPLANRIGVWKLKSELEDLCFKHSHPKEYASLSERVAACTGEASIMGPIEDIKEKFDQQNISVIDLVGRPKNLYGIHKKMVKKGRFLDEIYDLRAVRIVVETEEECFRALSEVHQIWKPMEGKFKDYISVPKANGYQSLHTVVYGNDGKPLEIQIRTKEMHYMAEYGVAAHWRYKEGVKEGTCDAFLEKQVEWARFVLSWQCELKDQKYRIEGDKKTSGCFQCPFPEHTAECQYRNYEAGPESCWHGEQPKPPSNESDPVFVIVVQNHHTSVLELPAHTTTTQLQAMLKGEHSAVDEERLIVNGMPVGTADLELHMGDAVQVVPRKIQHTVGLPVGGVSLEAQRSALENMFSQTEQKRYVPAEAGQACPPVGV